MVSDSSGEQASIWEMSRSLFDLALEYGDKFDLIRRCLTSSHHEEETDSQISATLGNISHDIRLVLVKAKGGTEVRLDNVDENGLVLGRAMHEFRDEWYEKQISFFNRLIDTFLSDGIDTDTIQQFLRQMDETTNHMRWEFSSVREALRDNALSQLIQSQGIGKEELLERYQMVCKIGPPPELDCTGPLFAGVVSERLESMKGKPLEELRDKTARLVESSDIPDKTVALHPDDAVTVYEHVPPTSATKVPYHESWRIKQSLDHSNQVARVALHGSLANVEEYYRTSPFAQEEIEGERG